MVSLLEQAKKKIAFQQITEKKTNIALDKELSMCYTESMTEQKDTSMRRNSGYRLWKWLLGSIAALKETTVAVPEDATGTYGKQSSKTNPPKRSYEVVAVVPIEFFTPSNRKKVRNELLQKSNNFRLVFSPSNVNNLHSKPHSRIGEHIKDFSAYEYEIYEIINRDPWSKAVCKIVNEEMKKCKPEENNYAKEIIEKLIKNDKMERYLEVKIILAMPFVPENSKENAANEEKSDTDESSMADINQNTGIVISIQISVCHIEIDRSESNIAMAKFLKLIGDGLNREINELQEKSIIKLKEKMSCESESKYKNSNPLVFEIISLLPCDFSDNNDTSSKKNGDHSKTRRYLHNEIEINYVFIYFICKGFDFHILTDTYNVDDNIKYSGDAWFLKKGKIYINTRNNKYVSDNYYFKQIKDKGQQNNFVELSENETYYWLTETLIPEAQIRPKDIYYIPKINGGDRHDYSSVLLKFRNRLCCFIKEKYANDSDLCADADLYQDADDQNRIVGMQIILNSFWHRLVEFSRVMQKLCLTSERKENENRGSKNIEENLVKMGDIKSKTRSSFLNQIYTTPTLPEQILDINSTDQDVLTLRDLAISSKIDSAANIFSEVKKNFLSLNTENINRERTKKAEKAEMGIQGMFLILALIASAIGLIELWADWNIDLWLEIFGTVLLFILVVGYLDWRYWRKLSKILGKCRKIWEKHKSRSKSEEEPSENNSEKLQ